MLATGLVFSLIRVILNGGPRVRALVLSLGALGAAVSLAIRDSPFTDGLIDSGEAGIDHFSVIQQQVPVAAAHLQVLGRSLWGLKFLLGFEFFKLLLELRKLANLTLN